MQIIGKATPHKADNEKYFDDLPPKAKRQASLPSQTATAVSVHHEASSKLKPLNSAPPQTTADSSKPAVSAETDADAGTNNDDSENTDTGTSNEQQVHSFILFNHLSTVSATCMLLFCHFSLAMLSLSSYLLLISSLSLMMRV